MAVINAGLADGNPEATRARDYVAPIGVCQ